MMFWLALRELLGLSFRADRRGAWITIVAFTLRPVATVGMSLAIAGMVAVWVAGDLTTGLILLGVACVALAAQVLLGRFSLGVSAVLIDRTNRFVDEDLQRWLYRAGNIEHYAERDFLDDMHVVRSEQPRLTEGADVIGLILGTILRLGMTVAVTVLASPWLILVPLASVGAYLCARQRDKAVGAAHRAAASDAGRSAELAKIGTDEKHISELFLSRGGIFLLGEHAEAAKSAESTRSAGRWRGAMWVMFGALFTSAALALGIAGLIGSLAEGGTDFATTLAALLLLASTTTLVSSLVRYLSSCADSVRVTSALGRLRERLHRDAPRALEGESHEQSIASIELDNLTYRYPGTSGAALDELSLRLNAGNVYALVGANGSGKSTLVGLLSGLLTPTGGRILVDGVDLSLNDAHGRVLHPTYIAQDFAELEFELSDAVRLGDSRFKDSDVADAVESAGLESIVRAHGVGLSLPLGTSMEGGQGLSGGQWQRVALARGFLRSDVSLLLLDEPTAAIDPIAEELLLERLTERARLVARTRGGIAVIVTHRMSLAPAADSVILLEKGRVVATGPHHQLLQEPSYARLYDAQREGYQLTGSYDE